MRPCYTPGCPNLHRNRGNKCNTCARQAEQTRGSREHRGYDWNHRKLRAEWKPRVATGTVACAKCHKLIAPTAPWDLGHVPLDRTRYRGPEHEGCNRKTTSERRNGRR